jgi:hypothetical protein
MPLPSIILKHHMKGITMRFELSKEITEIGARVLAGLTNAESWPPRLPNPDNLGGDTDLRFHEAMTIESTAFLQAVAPLLASDILNQAADILDSSKRVSAPVQVQGDESSKNIETPLSTHESVNMIREMGSTFEALPPSSFC